MWRGCTPLATIATLALAAPVCAGFAQIPTPRNLGLDQTPRVTAQTPAPRDRTPSTASSDPDPTTSDPIEKLPENVPPRQAFAASQRQLAEALERGDLARARTIAERQEQLFPDEMKAGADLGAVLLRLDDQARAEPYLRAALTRRSRLYDGNAALVLGSIYADLAQIEIARNRSREAISLLQRSIDYDPTGARPRFLLAEVFRITGDSERAIRELRAAFDVDETAARAADYLAFARTLREDGKTDDALAISARGIERFPIDIDLRIEHALALRASGEATQSLYELLYARMLLPERSPHREAIAQQVDQLRQIADGSTPEPDVELETMFSYLHDASTDQHDQGLPTILQVVGMQKEGRFVPRLLLAQSYIATGRFGEAERILLKLAELEPRSLPVLTELASLYYLEGRNQRARAIVDRALRLDPRNARLREVVASWGN